MVEVGTSPSGPDAHISPRPTPNAPYHNTPSTRTEALGSPQIHSDSPSPAPPRPGLPGDPHHVRPIHRAGAVPLLRHLQDHECETLLIQELAASPCLLPGPCPQASGLERVPSLHSGNRGPGGILSPLLLRQGGMKAATCPGPSSPGPLVPTGIPCPAALQTACHRRAAHAGGIWDQAADTHVVDTGWAGAHRHFQSLHGKVGDFSLGAEESQLGDTAGAKVRR